ncbi:uncharacterized protein Dwil_GK21926 [Drosophila willistoni]|nr:uncharacterized protein Dwil_GK21926 [Drosophila willistoni]
MANEKLRSFLGFFRKNLKSRRLFWLCVILLSGWNMTSIFILTINRYNTDSTSIGVTTTYIRWTNTFPAVSICLSKNRITSEFSNAVKRRVAGDAPPSYIYIRTIFDYLFVNPNNFYIKGEYCKDLNSTCGVDILDMRKELLARSCNQFVEKIYFSEKLMANCEDIFKFHELEMGYCFLANNLLDYKTIDLMPLKYSPSDKYRNLKLILRSGLTYRYDLYIHSPEDVPYFNAVSYTIASDPSVHSFNVEEIYNNDDVIYENVNQRMCKFPTESNDKHIFYSFSNCMSQIRNEMEVKLCNCTLFANSKEDSSKYCGIKGLSCLDEANLSGKVKDFVGTTLACLPSCVEQQINYVGSRETKSEEYPDANYVEIEIASAPSARYYRTVTQTKLDLVVAIGGVIGLFIGASLLNILEVISLLSKQIKDLLVHNCL